MKKIGLFLLLSLTLIYSSPLQANDNRQLFQQANDLYKTGHYQDALAKYQAIGDKSNIVHYNIGNCYYKLKQPGRALASWRRAEYNWGWADRQELAKNIHFVTTVHDRQEQTSKLKQMINRLYSGIKTAVRITPLWWMQLLVLVVWLFLFGFLAYLRKERKKAAIIFLFFLLAISAGLLGLKYSQRLMRQGVVLNEAPVRSGPGVAYQQLTTVGEGKEVRIRKMSDEYYKISFLGCTGWISMDSVEEV